MLTTQHSAHIKTYYPMSMTTTNSSENNLLDRSALRLCLKSDNKIK